VQKVNCNIGEYVYKNDKFGEHSLEQFDLMSVVLFYVLYNLDST